MINKITQVPDQLSFLPELWEHGQVQIEPRLGAFSREIIIPTAFKPYLCRKKILIFFKENQPQVSRVSPEERDIACDACEAAVQVVSPPSYGQVLVYKCKCNCKL